MGFKLGELSGFRAAESTHCVFSRAPQRRSQAWGPWSSGLYDTQAPARAAPNLQGGLIPGLVLVPSSSRPSRSTHQQ